MESKENNPIFISLITNFLLMIGKGIVGLLANSNALVADAAHSMSDVIFFLINYRACKECQMYAKIDKKRTSKKNDQKIVETEARATYYTGIILFTIGMTICSHNFMILVLGKEEKPNSITILAAFISLGIYAWLYKYLEKSNNKEKDCFLTAKNTFWQNKINLISGTVVVVGLIGTLFGFIFMDEVAAIVVGSIVLSMGIKLFIEAVEHSEFVAKCDYKPVIACSIIVSMILTIISLSIQL